MVGVLKNGNGPVVMLRTELDALPVEEATGLPYASTVRTKDDSGADVGVAHACGHDIHMAAWMATARIMATRRVTAALVREVGPARVRDVPPEMAAEDMSEFQRAGVPTLMLRIGAVEQTKYDAAMKSGEALPSLHSPLFAPDREPTIKAAVTAEVVALRELMPASPASSHK